MAILLVPWLLAGCGIAQEAYDAVLAERDSLLAQLQSVQGQVDSIKSELQTIQNEYNTSKVDLESTESKFAAIALELDSVQDELDRAKSVAESAKSDLTDKESELLSVQGELTTVKAELEDALTQLIEAEAPEVISPQVTGQTYQNTKYGFSCDFPEGWVIDEGIDYAVLFAGPIEGEYDYMSTVQIVVIESLVVQNLEDLVSMSDLTTKATAPSYTVVQQYETTIGGVPAIVQVFTFDPVDTMGYPVKGAAATFTKGKTIYMILLDVTEDVYENNRDEFILVTETFKFE